MILWMILIIIGVLLYIISLVAVSYFYKGFDDRIKDSTYIKTVAINIIITIIMFTSLIYYGNFSSTITRPLLKNIIIVFLFIDTLHFWYHYITHNIIFIKKTIHSTHHTITNILPLDSIYLDNIDFIIYTTINLYAPLLFINNYMEYIILILITALHSATIHSDISTTFILPMFNEPKFHTLHHTIGSGNYSVFFPFWDDYMRTRIKDIIVEKTDTAITMDEFNSMCKNGRKLTIINNEVIDCEKWIHSHPGGKTVIENLIGKDSSNEFNQIHGDSSVAKNMLKNLKIADIDDKTT